MAEREKTAAPLAAEAFPLAPGAELDGGYVADYTLTAYVVEGGGPRRFVPFWGVAHELRAATPLVTIGRQA